MFLFLILRTADISRDGPFSQSSHSDEDDFSLPLSEDEEMEDEDSSLVSIDEEDKSSGSAMFSELLQAIRNSPTNRQGESPKHDILLLKE